MRFIRYIPYSDRIRYSDRVSYVLLVYVFIENAHTEDDYMCTYGNTIKIQGKGPVEQEQTCIEHLSVSSILWHMHIRHSLVLRTTPRPRCLMRYIVVMLRSSLFTGIQVYLYNYILHSSKRCFCGRRGGRGSRGSRGGRGGIVF